MTARVVPARSGKMSAVTDSIDWTAIERAAAAQLIAAVNTVHDTHPNEKIYGALFHEFYGDGTAIAWPMVTVGTEESLAEVVAAYIADGSDESGLEASLRWSGPDLAHGFDPETDEQSLADLVQVTASESGGFETWEAAYDRFLRCFPKAAKAARSALVTSGAVGRDFVAIASDESGELVPLSLTKAQIRRHFPEYDAAERERRRLAALPIDERVVELLQEAVLPRYAGPLIGEHEGLLVACGAAALPALVRVVRGEEHARGAVTAARLLADINIDTPEVIEALEALMLRRRADENARAWAASALSRMGRSDIVLGAAGRLPDDVIVRGITDPLRSFRDHGAHRPLDYRPVETALRELPHLEVALQQELQPGVGYCVLAPDEYSTARAALDSEWQLVREHARLVLTHAGVTLDG